MVNTKDHLEHHRKAFQKSAERHAKMGPPRHHSSAKRTVMVALVAVLVLLASAASVFAYMWYQSPERIVMNAVLNTANQSALGFTGEYKANQSNIAFSGRTVDDRTIIDGKGSLWSLPMSGSVTVINGRSYVKSDQLSQVLPGLLAKKLSVQSRASLTQFAKEKLDGKWVELDSSSTDFLPGASGSSACIADFFQKVSSSQQARLQVVDLYRQHPFIKVIERPTSTKEIEVYQLSIDLQRYIAFKAALKKTDLHASMIKCTNDTAIMTEDEAQNLSIEVSIDMNKTRLVGVKLHNPDKQTYVTANLTFDVTQSVAQPADVVKVSDVQAEVMQSVLSARLKQLLGQ